MSELEIRLKIAELGLKRDEYFFSNKYKFNKTNKKIAKLREKLGK